MQSLSYGTLPDCADIVTACNGEHYKMELVGDDSDVVTRAISQGIDAHLEAVRFSQFDAGHKLGVEVEAESMPVLLRRLNEIHESGDDSAGDLASSILSTLGFEWV